MSACRMERIRQAELKEESVRVLIDERQKIKAEVRRRVEEEERKRRFS